MKADKSKLAFIGFGIIYTDKQRWCNIVLARNEMTKQSHIKTIFSHIQKISLTFAGRYAILYLLFLQQVFT